MILIADSEGPGQTARMRSLIWAFAVRICPKTFFFFFLMARPICSGRLFPITSLCICSALRVYSETQQNLTGHCGHMTFIQRRINVETKSWRLYNVAFMSMQRLDVYVLLAANPVYIRNEKDNIFTSERIWYFHKWKISRCYFYYSFLITSAVFIISITDADLISFSFSFFFFFFFFFFFYSSPRLSLFLRKLSSVGYIFLIRM